MSTDWRDAEIQVFQSVKAKKNCRTNSRNDKGLLFMSAVKFLRHGLPTAYNKSSIFSSRDCIWHRNSPVVCYIWERATAYHVWTYKTEAYNNDDSTLTVLQEQMKLQTWNFVEFAENWFWNKRIRENKTLFILYKVLK